MSKGKTVKIKTTMPNAKSSSLNTSMGELKFDANGVADMEASEENLAYVKKSPLFFIAKVLTPAEIKAAEKAAEAEAEEDRKADEAKEQERLERIAFDAKVEEYIEVVGETPTDKMTLEGMDKVITETKEAEVAKAEAERKAVIAQVKEVLNIEELRQIATDNADKLNGADFSKLKIDALIDLLLSNGLIDLGTSGE